MTSTIKVIVFLAMLVLSAILSSIVAAQVETRLQDIVDGVYGNTIDFDAAKQFYDNLPASQQKRLEVLMAAKVGISENTWNAIVQQSQGASNHGQSLLQSNSLPQMIEKTSSYWQMIGQQNFRSSSNCDGDSSDSDWLFIFFPRDYSNPNGLRWNTTSTWVAFAFYVSYRNNLLGVSTDGTVGLCIGDRGVLLAGGAWHVHAHLWLLRT